jgi:hypothetical protein
VARGLSQHVEDHPDRLVLAGGGLPADAVSKPPLQVTQVPVNVPTGLKKPAFRRVPAWHVSQAYSIETGNAGIGSGEARPDGRASPLRQT